MTTPNNAEPDTIAIDSLDLSGRLRPADDAYVRLLTAVIDETPPVLVHDDGGTLRLLDGFQRVDAARALGRSEVRAELLGGPAAAAWAYAVKINCSHGLPMSLSQRRQAASRLLALAPDWSDRRLASACGLDHKTVGRLRKRDTGRAGGENRHPRSQERSGAERIGRDGRRYRSSEELERRRDAARQLLSSQSGLSDRRAGREVGLSGAAVCRVRERQQPQAPQSAQTRHRSVDAPVRWRSLIVVVSTAVQTVRAVVRRLVGLVRVRLRRR